MSKSSLESRLEELERERVEALAKYRRGMVASPPVAAIACALFGALFFGLSRGSVAMGAYVFLAVSASCFFGLRRGARLLLDRTVVDTLREVTRIVIKDLDPSLDLDATGGIEKDVFLGSALYHRTPFLYRSRDLVSGQVAGVGVRFAKVIAVDDPKHSVNDGESGRSYFSGLFFVVDLGKTLQGTTYVMPADADWKPPQGVERATLEDPEFHRHFAVYGHDQIEARYVLTPDLMESLSALAVAGASPRLRFDRRHLAIALPHADVGVPFDPFKTAIDADYVRAETAHLAFVGKLVRALSLGADSRREGA